MYDEAWEQEYYTKLQNTGRRQFTSVSYVPKIAIERKCATRVFLQPFHFVLKSLKVSRDVF